MAASLIFAIMDRNPHVRELICRELSARGHRANPVRSAAEAAGLLSGPLAPQVLVVDPEAAEGRLSEIAAAARRLPGRVALVLHVYGDAPALGELPGALVVEKQAHLGPLLALAESLSRGAAPVAGGDVSGNEGARGAGV